MDKYLRNCLIIMGEIDKIVKKYGIICDYDIVYNDGIIGLGNEVSISTIIIQSKESGFIYSLCYDIKSLTWKMYARKNINPKDFLISQISD